jgi:antitoxin component of MazEF toxin-antitoxin module
MKTAIRKMGNSHGVIIPKPLLSERCKRFAE